MGIASAPVRVASSDILVTASIGATVIGAGSSAKDGLIVADQALYVAKDRGRNRVIVLQRREAETACAEIA